MTPLSNMEAQNPRTQVLNSLQELNYRAELAYYFNISPQQLRFLLYGLTRNRRYKEIELQKRSGGIRIIRAPIKPLKEIQKGRGFNLEVQL